MHIPVFAVTGFFESGKTSFINNLLNRKDYREINVLYISFESGEEVFENRFGRCEKLFFPKKRLENDIHGVALEICETIKASGNFDEIWVEWNAVTPFYDLHALLLSDYLRNFCKLHKVIHIANGEKIESLLGKTGDALPEQIAASDLVLIRGMDSANKPRLRRLLRGLNKGVKIYGISHEDNYLNSLFARRENTAGLFFLAVIAAAVVLIGAKPILKSAGVPADTVINIFIGMILQAIPFLLIGVLISSAIQIFIPQSFIERRFPKSLGPGMLAAVLAGFCFPVCDCASIPVFRSLVKKGIPLPVAVTFMTCAPVINPVVMLSTYYAFGGNIKIMLARVLMGVISGVLIGVVFAVRPGKNILSGGAFDGLMCSCGCFEGAESVSSLKGKVGLFLRHSQAEFFDVGKYLIIGTFIASVFQTIGTEVFAFAQSGAGTAISLAIMMVMAFVISLCSSSDAVIGRSFSGQFPMTAIMGFLVFGPMMDIKNILMLSGSFTKRFVLKLLAAAFVVCFVVVMLFSLTGGF